MLSNKIGKKLHHFAESVATKRCLGEKDFINLARDVLCDGPLTREEADVLIALDRSDIARDPRWDAWFVATIVEFCVWTSRPTGIVDHATAQWLVTSLGCGGGPTENAWRIAAEIVREADRVDDMLLLFVMREGRMRVARPEAPPRREAVASRPALIRPLPA